MTTKPMTRGDLENAIRSHSQLDRVLAEVDRLTAELAGLRAALAECKSERDEVQRGFDMEYEAHKLTNAERKQAIAERDAAIRENATLTSALAYSNNKVQAQATEIERLRVAAIADAERIQGLWCVLNDAPAMKCVALQYGSRWELDTKAYAVWYDGPRLAALTPPTEAKPAECDFCPAPSNHKLCTACYEEQSHNAYKSGVSAQPGPPTEAKPKDERHWADYDTLEQAERAAVSAQPDGGGEQHPNADWLTCSDERAQQIRDQQSAPPAPEAVGERHVMFFVEERRPGYWLSDGPEYATRERAQEKHEENLREGFRSRIVRVTEIREVITPTEADGKVKP
jgi:hypothetical protein